MRQSDYEGMEAVQAAIEEARRGREHAEAARLARLDHSLRALVLTPEPWATTSPDLREEALQFPEAVRSVWEDAPEVLEASLPALPLRPALAIALGVFGLSLLWAGRGVFASPSRHEQVRSLEERLMEEREERIERYHEILDRVE